MSFNHHFENVLFWLLFAKASGRCPSTVLEIYASVGDTDVAINCSLPPNPVPFWSINGTNYSRRNLPAGYEENRQLRITEVLPQYNATTYQCFYPNISQGLEYTLYILTNVPTIPRVEVNGSQVCFESQANPDYPVLGYRVSLLGDEDGEEIFLTGDNITTCQCIDLSLQISTSCDAIEVNVTAFNINGSSEAFISRIALECDDTKQEFPTLMTFGREEELDEGLSPGQLAAVVIPTLIVLIATVTIIIIFIIILCAIRRIMYKTYDVDT